MDTNECYSTVQLQMGKAYYYNNDTDYAMYHFNKSIICDQNNIQSYHNLINVYLQMKDYSSVIHLMLKYHHILYPYYYDHNNSTNNNSNNNDTIAKIYVTENVFTILKTSYDLLMPFTNDSTYLFVFQSVFGQVHVEESIFNQTNETTFNYDTSNDIIIDVTDTTSDNSLLSNYVTNSNNTCTNCDVSGRIYIHICIHILLTACDAMSLRCFTNFFFVR